MKKIEEITEFHGSGIREAITTFLVPLQATKIIKKDAFEELVNAINALAQALKGHDFVSKSLLDEIYTTIRVLRNEAPHFHSETAVLENMADQLEMLFALILIGETPNDRTPGVPRII